MPRVSYVNGQYLRHRQAAVHVEERGYQFADAIYEVIAIVGGRLVDDALHFERLERSLREIRMEMPFSREIFRLKIAELLRLNRLRNGSLYIQVSRGVAPRNHKLPETIIPSVVITLRPLVPPSVDLLKDGIAVITVPDIRWKRPDIKSVALLANILAKDEAVRRNVYEAWQVNSEGEVTEGTSTNAWIVKDGCLVTHPAGTGILNGVTRLALLKIANRAGVDIAFLTSTASFLIPVVRIDDKQIGDGRPGPVSAGLLARYSAHLWSNDA